MIVITYKFHGMVTFTNHIFILNQLILCYQHSAKIEPPLYYLNDKHREVPDFSRWWTNVYRHPSNSLVMDEVIHIEDINKFVKVCMFFCIFYACIKYSNNR